MKLWRPMSKYLFLIMLAFVAGCSGGGTSAPTPTGEPSTPTTQSTSDSCVAEHEPMVDSSGAHAVTWTKTLCGPSAPYETVFINENTTDDTGQVFGLTRNINRGRVTWEFTNLDYTDLKWPNNGDDIMFMGFIALHDAADYEANWHILGNRFGEAGPIETRLVTQRPFDTVCIPNAIRYCEKQWSDTQNPYNYERAKKYKWDCQWNTTIESGLPEGTYGAYSGLIDGRIYCDLYDVTTTTQLLNTYYMPTSGPYGRLNFFVAGGDAVTYFNKAGVPMIISNFRFSIME